MKELKILSLTIKNFKGIKKMELDLTSNSTIVTPKYKTSIIDAVHWALFNRDYEARTQFQFANVNNPTEVFVEVVIEYEGEEYTFQHYHNGKSHSYGELSKKQHEQLLMDMLEEDTIKLAEYKFRILSNPEYKYSLTKNTDRRDMLLDYYAEKSNLGYAKDLNLKHLSVMLEEEPLKEITKKVKSGINKKRKELEQFPQIINELSSKLQETQQEDEVISKITMYKEQISKISPERIISGYKHIDMLRNKLKNDISEEERHAIEVGIIKYTNALNEIIQENQLHYNDLKEKVKNLRGMLLKSQLNREIKDRILELRLKQNEVAKEQDELREIENEITELMNFKVEKYRDIIFIETGVLITLRGIKGTFNKKGIEYDEQSHHERIEQGLNGIRMLQEQLEIVTPIFIDEGNDVELKGNLPKGQVIKINKP